MLSWTHELSSFVRVVVPRIEVRRWVSSSKICSDLAALRRKLNPDSLDLVFVDENIQSITDDNVWCLRLALENYILARF